MAVMESIGRPSTGLPSTAISTSPTRTALLRAADPPASSSITACGPLCLIRIPTPTRSTPLAR
eukprot:3940636-Rhodomonas_salina.1